MVLDLENIPVLTARAQRTDYRRCRTPGRPGATGALPQSVPHTPQPGWPAGQHYTCGSRHGSVVVVVVGVVDVVVVVDLENRRPALLRVEAVHIAARVRSAKPQAD